MSANHATNRRVRQHGMVLLLCLMFMTSMTLLGLTAASDTIVQTQLTANLHDAERARQTALLSLRWAEDWLLGPSGSAPHVCSTGCTGFYAHPEGGLEYDLQSKPMAWWTAKGYEVGVNPDSGAQLASVGLPGSEPSIWVIQSLHLSPASEDGSVPEHKWYRILVRSTGRSPSTVSVLESIVKTAWDSSGTASTSGQRVAWQELR